MNLVKKVRKITGILFLILCIVMALSIIAGIWVELERMLKIYHALLLLMVLDGAIFFILSIYIGDVEWEKRFLGLDDN